MIKYDVCSRLSALSPQIILKIIEINIRHTKILLNKDHEMNYIIFKIFGIYRIMLKMLKTTTLSIFSIVKNHKI